MRDNLVFTGIEEPEALDGEYENTEKVLCEFLETEMNINKPISFHRVHRIGNKMYNYDSPRPIVAKFEHFKEREEVRFTAPKTLKGKPYGVREQFPKVVEEKRKILYPEMKKARSDSRNKVRLVRDKLFINNVEFVPDENVYTQQNQTREKTRSNSDRRGYQRDKNLHSSGPSYSDSSQNKDRAINIGYGKTRYIYPRAQGRNVNFSEQQLPRSKPNSYSLPTSNMFENLPVEDANTNQTCQTPVETKKHKASSPLDTEKTFKKHRENENSDQESSVSDDSHVSYIEVDKSPQCDPPQMQGRTLSQPSLQTIDLPSSCNSAKLCNIPVSSTQQQDVVTSKIKQKTVENVENQTSKSNSSVNLRLTTASEKENQSCDESVNHA
ncbi:MAG: hypothetical protein AB2693_26940 [Candidatus Thiodiazotropha sp.]